MTTEQEYLTVAEAARLLRLSHNTIWAMLRRGDLPGTKVGHQFRLPRAELQRRLRGDAVTTR